MWYASVHATFSKEDMEPLASRVTEGLGEPSACFLPGKEPAMSIHAFQVVFVNSYLANADCFD